MATLIDRPRVWCENCREEIAPVIVYRDMFACRCPGFYSNPRVTMGVDAVKGRNDATEDTNQYPNEDGARH